jgi:hypothetical protein
MPSLLPDQTAFIGGLSISRNTAAIKQNGKDMKDATHSHYTGRYKRIGIIGLQRFG